MVFAHQLIALLGGEGDVAAMAVRYLRIASLGVPCALVALAGQGWLRGVGNLRTPLVIIVAANVVNVVLEVLFVYGFDWGLDGSAWGTVIAQAGMGIAFVTVLLRAPADSRAPDRERIRSLVSIGAQLFVRTAALLGCFVLATAICARIGQASLGAHQIAFQLFGFLALVLDAIAIAGQVIVGRALGASDTEAALRRRPADARVVGGRRGPHRRRPPRPDRRHPARVHERPRGARARARHVAVLLPAVAAGGDRLRARRHPHRGRRHPLPRARDGRVAPRSTSRSRSRRSRSTGGSWASGARCSR